MSSWPHSCRGSNTLPRSAFHYECGQAGSPSEAAGIGLGSRGDWPFGAAYRWRCGSDARDAGGEPAGVVSAACADSSGGSPNNGNRFSVSRNEFQAAIRAPTRSRTMSAQGWRAPPGPPGGTGRTPGSRMRMSGQGATRGTRCRDPGARRGRQPGRGATACTEASTGWRPRASARPGHRRRSGGTRPRSGREALTAPPTAAPPNRLLRHGSRGSPARAGWRCSRRRPTSPGTRRSQPRRKPRPRSAVMRRAGAAAGAEAPRRRPDAYLAGHRELEGIRVGGKGARIRDGLDPVRARSRLEGIVVGAGCPFLHGSHPAGALRQRIEQTFVAIRLSHVRSDARPSNWSRPRHARTIVS